MFKSPQFAELSEESLAFILESDNLQADEAEIYEAVKEWGTVNMVIAQSTLKESLSTVIHKVRRPSPAARRPPPFVAIRRRYHGQNVTQPLPHFTGTGRCGSRCCRRTSWPSSRRKTRGTL